MAIKINKEFAPISITINTPQDLSELKELAAKAVSSDSDIFWQFRDICENPWMRLARQILEL